MSVSFDVVAANAYVSFTAGNAAASGTGPRTLAALVRPKSGNNNAGFLGLYTGGGSVIVDLFEAGNRLFGQNDFSNGFGPASDGNASMTQDTDYVVALTHPGTSAPWRMHIWPVDFAHLGGASTMYHGVSSSNAQNHTQTGTATSELRIGGVDVKGNGTISVVAFWNRECTDFELDGLKTDKLTDWIGLAGGGPDEGWHFRDWDTTGGSAVRFAGTSTFSSITGTTTAGANPTGFDFSIATAMGQGVGLTQPF